jgi:hypothetical protein
MLEPAPIGTHAGHFFAEPEFSAPADERRKHMALFGGTGIGKSTLLLNMAASDLAVGQPAGLESAANARASARPRSK